MSTQEMKQSDLVPSTEKPQEIDIKEEQKDVDVQEEIANAMSGDRIKELLAADGPTVKAVLLKSDGSVQEILYDSTPSKNHVTEILGAPPSIIGQYPDLDVIVVGPRCEESQKEFKINQHKLRYPFNNDTFYGDIFLYRFNQECVTVDFTAKEYQEFAAKADEDIGKVFKPLMNDAEDVQDDDEYDEEEYDEEEAQMAEEMMRNIIINKVKSEYPIKFGREPTEQELEDMVNATLAMFCGGFQEEEYDENEEEEEEDEDYNPEEDNQQAVNDEIEDIADDEQLENDKQDIEQTLAENEQPLQDVLDEEEEKIVNSDEFEKELRSAIEIVQNVAKIDKYKIMEMTRQSYKDETGEEPTEEMMAEALRLFAIDPEEAQDADNEMEQEAEEQEAEKQDMKEEDEIDPEVFAKEMEEALENVRKLGAAHQHELVGQIKKTYTELNGVEPTEEQMSGIFGRIKEKLQEEARDEFLEANGADDEEDVDDADYEPNEEDMQQVEDDKKIELLEEMIQNNLNMEVDDDVDGDKKKEKKVESNKVKVLVTPIKKGPSGSRLDIYLNEQPDTKKTLEVAALKFEQINGRAPTEDDTQRLKDFLATGMLFESEIDPQIPFDDEDDDEDYDPEKDTFDYSQDMEDDMEMEDGTDENNDTSNMIDID